MSNLDESTVYLAGPMEFASDGGMFWREEIIKRIHEVNSKIRILNPLTKSYLKNDHQLSDETEIFKKCKEEKNWSELTKLVKRIVRVDLRQVDLSDFLIVLVDINVHMCGSYHEIFTCSNQQKPVLVICPEGKHKVPGWLWGILDHNLFFESIEECVEYIRRVDSGEIDLDDRWVLLNR